MKAPKIIAAGLAIIVAISLLTVSAQAAPQKQKEAKKPEAKPTERIPKEIQAMMQEGLATRQGRQDIPFSVIRRLVLTAQANNLYPVFFFAVKNSALEFTAAGGQMEARPKVFLQMYAEDPAGTIKPVVQSRIEPVLTADSAAYDPEKEEWYSFGLALPHGKYVVSMAITSPDLKKVGINYTEVVLPGPDALQASLMATEPLIFKTIEQVQPDQRITIHKGLFTWGALQVVPNIDGVIKSGEDIEILLFVHGATSQAEPGQQPAYNIEINFEVRKEDGSAAIKWAPQAYNSYLVMQQLPLVQTLKITEGKNERTEKKPLGPGKYSLVALITDKVSGLKTESKSPFEVK